MLSRQSRGNQRTTGKTRLDHQHTQRQAADDPVSPGKITGHRPGIQRKLGDHRATSLDHRRRQRSVALWIKFLQPGTQHTDGLPAGVQGSLMRSAIDPQGQAAGNDKTTPGKTSREGRCCIERRPRRPSTANDRQLRFFQNGRVAGDKKQRRGVPQFGQQAWVAGVIPHQQMLVAGL
ncbi:hypothetical protein D3C79_866810 [compost metagenome]